MPMHLLRYFLLAMKGEFQMAVNETIVTGRKFRKLVDEATKLWQRISFWGVASDVEFDDGENAETKFGAISGITDSLTSTSSNVAASAAAVKALNDKITELNSDLSCDVPVILLNSGLRDGSNSYRTKNMEYTIPKSGKYTFSYICLGRVYYDNFLLINGIEIKRSNPGHYQNTYTANLNEGDIITYRTTSGNPNGTVESCWCIGFLAIS